MKLLSMGKKYQLSTRQQEEKNMGYVRKVVATIIITMSIVLIVFNEGIAMFRNISYD
jgi:hypothetical protein